MRHASSLRAFALSIAVLFAAVALSPAAAQEADLEAELTPFYESVAENWIAGDIAALVEQFTEDAIFWPSDGATLSGRAEIRAWLERLAETKSLKIEPIRIEWIGNYAFAVGRHQQSFAGGGGAVDFRGGFTGLLAKGGGGWKIHRLVSFPERELMR